MMRVALFIATNLAVMLVVGIVASVFGLGRGQGGIGGLLLLSAVIGMTGSIFSLLISKWAAKRSVGAEVITQPRNESESWLLNTVRQQAGKAGIGMPEVAVYDSPEMNAFATGWNRNNALVAVSTGLLRQMNRDEVEAVLAHEVSHVANGDMITLSLLQGVLNTFVVFFSSIVANIVSGFLRRGDSDGPGFLDNIIHTVVYIVLQMLFGVLASMIVMWFSRRREFRADHGGATLASRQSMINALRRLGGDRSTEGLPDGVEAFGIAGGKAGGFKRLFMSHPPLEERIAALEAAR